MSHLQVVSDEADQEYEDDFEVMKDSICQMMSIQRNHVPACAHSADCLPVFTLLCVILHALTVVFEETGKS